MGVQKKGAAAAKNVQAKKKGKQTFEVKEDDDIDNDSSEEEMEVLKPPANKTPKGRQSMGEKKVSFDLSGKNNKTPKRDTSLLTKKQPTPAAKGRASLPEFKGIKQNKTPQKGSDSEDEKNEEPVKNAKGQKKNKDQNGLRNKQKSPVKGVEKSKDIKNTPKTAQTAKAGQTPNKEMKKETLKMDDLQLAEQEKKMHDLFLTEQEKKRQRELTMLRLGKLPLDVTPEEIKTLSKSILQVEIRRSEKRRSNGKNNILSYAFLTFANEDKAEKNYKKLQTKKFRGQALTVDFVGEKSHIKKDKSKEEQYNPRKLFVRGIPLDATLADVAKFFPKSVQISFSKSSLYRSASIVYREVDDTQADYMTTQDIELDGHKLTVSLAVYSPSSRKNKRKRRQNNNGLLPAKKMKTTQFVNDK